MGSEKLSTSSVSRDWHGHNGEILVHGVFKALKDNMAQLRTNNEIIEIERNRLCNEDMIFILQTASSKPRGFRGILSLRITNLFSSPISANAASSPSKSFQETSVEPNRSPEETTQTDNSSTVCSQRSDPDDGSTIAGEPSFHESTLHPVPSIAPSDFEADYEFFSNAARHHAVRHYAVPEFCDFICSDAESQSARIVSMIRRKELTGVKQEFIIIKAIQKDGTDVWVRLQRSAPSPSSIRRLGSVSDMIRAKDKAIVADAENLLITGNPSWVQAIMEFQQAVTLQDLERILRAISAVSTKYGVLDENCFFYVSVLQQLLTELHGGYFLLGKLTNEHLGPGARDAIRTQLKLASFV